MQQTSLTIDTIVVLDRTGERFVSTHSDAWAERLETWQRAIRAMKNRLETDPVLRVATGMRVQRWDLYDLAKREGYKTIPPCPMPEGHCMFENPHAYGVRPERG